MDRRDLLILCSATVPASLLPGCLAAFSSGSSEDDERPTLPDGMSIDTVSFAGVTHGGTRESTERSIVLVSQTVAEENLATSGDEVSSFLAETDFQRDYLVSVQSTGSPDDRLRVDAIERADAGLQMDLRRVAPGDEYRESVTQVALLVRITDEGGVPETVSVEITDET